MKYSVVRNILDTGDIVLFSGNGLISNAIKLVDGSQWSHVGMVLKIKEYDSLLVWESTTLSDIKDIDTGTHIKGVQTVPLSQRLATYDGKVAIRKLIVLDDSAISRDNINETVMKFRSDMAGKPYEKNRLELIKSAYDGPLGLNKEDLSSVFCSELIAECYQRLNFLSDSVPSNEYTPAEFSTERDLNLSNHVRLSHEMMIDT